MRLVSPAALAVAATLALLPAHAKPGEESAREEIERSFRLAPGATIRAVGIGGPVTIETIAGDTAEVRIVRSARTQRELDCYRTAVDATLDRLAIEHVQFSDRPGCDSIRSNQDVRLGVPRDVNVELSTIAGRVDIGAVAGMIRLDSIAGPVVLTGVEAAQVDSLAGGLSITGARPGARGIHVSSVVGPVELSFARNADADVRISSVVGKVQSPSPGARSSGENGDYRLRIGAGGPAVSISSVMGPVRLRDD
jgi:hypothetical protein